jgi:hypothetical protein
MTALPDKASWIAGYVRRAQAVGFDCTATEDGCVYADRPAQMLVAMLCDCGCKSWGMFQQAADRPHEGERG